MSEPHNTHPSTDLLLRRLLEGSTRIEDKVDSVTAKLSTHMIETTKKFGEHDTEIASIKAGHTTDAKWAGRVWGMVSGCVAGIATWAITKFTEGK